MTLYAYHVGNGENIVLTPMLDMQLCSHSCLYSISRKAQESQKEMKLLLDMYRSAPKEQRDKVQLMAAEKKAKAEVNLIYFSIFLQCIT